MASNEESPVYASSTVRFLMLSCDINANFKKAKLIYATATDYLNLSNTVLKNTLSSNVICKRDSMQFTMNR